MEFIGTRGASPVYGGVAILKGIAPDGGLYVPSFFPKLDREELENMLWMDYPERAACIMKYFLDDYTEAELKEYADRAYARFKDGEPAPVIDIDGDSHAGRPPLWLQNSSARRARNPRLSDGIHNGVHD